MTHRNLFSGSALVLALLGIAALALAYSSGQNSATQKPGSTYAGCVCHSATPSGTVTVAITGPATVVVNSANSYTVAISGGPAVRSGVDIAAWRGTLATGGNANLKVVSGELVQSAPYTFTGGISSYTFQYTAPGTIGTDTLYATGLSANNSQGNNGDSWNFSPKFVISVVTALPIELASLTGSASLNGGVRLSWRTISEVNNYGFYVERRRPLQQDFAELPDGFIPGHGTTTVPQDYSFTDNTAGPGTWSYRLRQVDLDGTVHFSDPIQATSAGDGQARALPASFALDQNYPNPFNPVTEIRYALPAPSRVVLTVLDITGKTVATLVNGQEETGYHSVSFNAASLASGAYFYRLRADRGAGGEAGGFEATKKFLLVT